MLIKGPAGPFYFVVAALFGIERSQNALAARACYGGNIGRLPVDHLPSEPRKSERFDVLRWNTVLVSELESGRSQLQLKRIDECPIAGAAAANQYLVRAATELLNGIAYCPCGEHEQSRLNVNGLLRAIQISL